MKVIIIILNLIFFLISCTTKNHAYLHGYIYDYNMKPIEGIKVEDPYDATTYSITNKTGYFKINHLIKGEFLYVKKNNKKLDSIYVVRTHPEKGERHYFVEGRSDTLFIKQKL